MYIKKRLGDCEQGDVVLYKQGKFVVRTDFVFTRMGQRPDCVLAGQGTFLISAERGSIVEIDNNAMVEVFPTRQDAIELLSSMLAPDEQITLTCFGVDDRDLDDLVDEIVDEIKCPKQKPSLRR